MYVYIYIYGQQVVEQTLLSTEKLHAKIEASSNLNLGEHSILGEKLTAMIKDMQSDNAKPFFLHVLYIV